jgi:hypothetical protein
MVKAFDVAALRQLAKDVFLDGGKTDFRVARDTKKRDRNVQH